jgi:DNA repair protein RecN (Recombination protein N)
VATKAHLTPDTAPAENQLLDLSIRSLGVIKEADIDLSPGFTALTGETGAGKTMVLTSLQLLLGAKGDTDFIRVGDERMQVSATFKLSESVSQQLRDFDCEIEENLATITRTVSKTGRSKVSINGTQISQNQLSSITEQLIEIHSQSSALRLAKPSEQREFLDSFATRYEPNFIAARQRYLTLFEKYRDLEKRIKALKNESANREQQLEELNHLVKAGDEIRPEPHEITLVDEEILSLSSVEEINEKAQQLLNELENDEDAPSHHFARIRKSLDSLIGMDAALDDLVENMRDAMSQFSDSNRDLSTYLSRIEANPARFDYLQTRKAQLNSFIKKFGKGSDRIEAYNQLLVELENANQKLADLTGGDELLGQLENELSILATSLLASASELSTVRLNVGKELSRQVNAELKELGMPKSSLHVDVRSREQKASECDAFGNDDVSLLFQPFPESPLLALAKSASGGELSRLSLALDLVAANYQETGTYVFDEVDAGVGGRTASEIGVRLSRLSKRAQVIVVTHLAQVAVWADSHLLIDKDEGSDIAFSTLVPLSQKERVIEVARLLSGHENSQTALQHAQELLDEAT